jgi:hypothetical protein
MKKLFTLFVVFTLASLSTFAQLNVKFEGELRTRLEVDDLDFNANTGMHNYINNRARLSAIISNNDDLEFVVQNNRRQSVWVRSFASVKFCKS